MKNTVILKSYKDGITIYLDDTLEFEQLCLDLAQKFRDSARFFGDMQVAVSFEGRTLTQEEENILVDTITSSSRLQVLCVIGKDAGLQNQFSNATEAARYFAQKSASGDDGQFYRGSLKDGQILETEGSIVILGSVEEGCSIISTKDIIVLGRLAGNAYAGGDGRDHHFIAALEMTPQKLKIGDFKYKTKESRLWAGRLRKGQPQMACVRNGEIQMQSITKELLNELPV